MNERIRELLSQVGVHYEVMPKDTVYEKFAEMIVKECIFMADEFELDVNRVGLVDRIKEHFGVRE